MYLLSKKPIKSFPKLRKGNFISHETRLYIHNSFPRKKREGRNETYTFLLSKEIIGTISSCSWGTKNLISCETGLYIHDLLFKKKEGKGRNNLYKIFFLSKKIIKLILCFQASEQRIPFLAKQYFTFTSPLLSEKENSLHKISLLSNKIIEPIQLSQILNGKLHFPRNTTSMKSQKTNTQRVVFTWAAWRSNEATLVNTSLFRNSGCSNHRYGVFTYA